MTIHAGFATSTITPKVGSKLVGYSARATGSTGVHDDLHARALVIEGQGTTWALCAIELCFLSLPTVAQIREQVAAQVSIHPRHVLLCTVHTHSGPGDDEPGDWDVPLGDQIADVVVQAYEQRVPARVGAGRGFLFGHQVNRRFLDRPTDPGLAVLKVQDLHGNPLGVLVNWNCHPVVLGADNLFISADYPGVISRTLEERLGGGAVALYLSGSTGDVNPLTRGVREKLDGTYAIDTMADRICYYGTPASRPRFHIGDRAGGTFEEVSELGQAVADEAWKVARTIQAEDPSRPPWAASARVQARRVGAPPVDHPLRAWLAGPDWDGQIEVIALGVGEMALVGEPGEVFVETYVAFKRRLWQMGFGVPMASSYANGFIGYLPPAGAYPEGGYEVGIARAVGLREDLQERVWEAIELEIARHAGTVTE